MKRSYVITTRVIKQAFGDFLIDFDDDGSAKVEVTREVSGNTYKIMKGMFNSSDKVIIMVGNETILEVTKHDCWLSQNAIDAVNVMRDIIL